MIPQWMDSAACAEFEYDYWHSDSKAEQQIAKSICKACFVKDRCKLYALDMKIQEGIWGGMNFNQRSYWARVNRYSSDTPRTTVSEEIRYIDSLAKRSMKVRGEDAEEVVQA